MLSPNKLIRKRYRIIRQVAQGGMGAIYQAEDQQSGESVALKQNLRSETILHKAFKREAGLLASLKHPSLPGFIDFFEDEEGQFLVTEFIGGDDLAAGLTHRARPYPLPQVMDWADQLLDVLEFLHKRTPPVIHRDIKPQNIKCNTRGRIILLDFGLAKGTPAYSSLATSLAGYTLSFAPPEQIHGDGTDGRSDLYSLAATLFNLLTMRRPPDALRRSMDLLNHKPDPLPAIHTLNNEVPISVSLILSKALALKPEQRFSDAKAMRQSLKTSIDEGTTEVDYEGIFSTTVLATNNLPVRLTPLIGREQEISILAQMLQSADVRLLTLTGTAGIGKTRLGLEIAASSLNQFPDGVFFVALDAIRESSLVLPTIAAALEVKESGESSLIERVKQRLFGKTTLLFVDNFEQVIPAASVLATLLETCPGLKALVTSRERLRLSGEHEFPLQPLRTPDLKNLPETASLPLFPAVDLFLQRAQAVKPGFVLDDTNAAAVAELCARLDGLPLAIELAATRIKLFSPQAMLEHLDNRFHLLRGGARDLPARQQTLHASIDWSYELLDAGEKQLFWRLAVFIGGRTLPAIEAVCDPSDDPNLSPLQIDIYDGLASLIDKSLVRQSEKMGDEPRYEMLTTIYEYALERLEKNGEAGALRRMHAAYYLDLARKAEANLSGQNQAAWLQRLEREHDNLRAALSWSLQEKPEVALLMGGALWRFWEVYGHLSEGRKWLQAALDQCAAVESPELAKALYAAGQLAIDQGDYTQARPLFEQTLQLSAKLEDQASKADALNGLGRVAYFQGENELAARYYEEALQLREFLKDKAGQVSLLNNIAVVATSVGDNERALRFFEKSLALTRELGNDNQAGYLLGNMGTVALDQGNIELAKTYFQQSLDLELAVGDQWGISFGYQGLARCAFLSEAYGPAHRLLVQSLETQRYLGDKYLITETLRAFAELALKTGLPQRAAILFAADKALRNAINLPIQPADVPSYEQNLNELRAQLSEETLTSAWSHGKRLSMEQAIAYALGENE